jgi:hypothetical protein
MSATLLKTLGTLHGLFGIYVLAFVWVAYTQGLFHQFGLGPVAIANKIAGSVIVATPLLGCAVASWRFPGHAATFAWAALATFVVAALSDVIFKFGLLGGIQTLIPSFYVGVVVRALTATALWVLARPSSQIGG